MEDIEEQEIVKPKKGRTGILVLLLLFFLGSAGANFWLWDKEKKSSSVVNSKIDSLQAYHTLKDSLYAALAEEEEKVAGLRAEIILYQDDNDSLRVLLDEKIAKIASLRAMVSRGGSPATLRALKDSISRISASNLEFKGQVETLLLENDDYKSKLMEQENQITALENQKKMLKDKVDIASQPSCGPVIVTPMYEKKGIFIPQFKARKVDRLQITFDILGNKLTAKTVEKEYRVRVKDPDGIVLSNNNSQLSNSDDLYTVKENVSFNGTQQKIKVNFTQDPSYKKGKYKVELKEGSEVIQTFSFELM
jgi:flagellar basal body-associated protein FliL